MRASVVIPVHDGGEALGAVLEALASQQLPGGLEIVALDSGSRDGSRERLVAAGARVLDVAPGEFDHGETRNRGVREARGETVLFLSQDALPLGPHYARALVAALAADDRLAGVFARQHPRADADPLTRRDLAQWVAGGGEPRVSIVEDRARFDTLPPLERYRLAAFDNVASAAPRALLLEHPFPASRFGEDLEWGLGMLLAGRALGYAPSAAVRHSHPRRARALYRRNYLGHRLLYRLFGLRTVPDLPHLLRAAAGASLADLRALGAARPARLLAAPVQAWAATLGQYRGARDEAAKRPYPVWA